MKKEIIINDDKTEVTLMLSLKKRQLARDPRMTVTTVMAKTMLENEKFKLDKCIKSDIINNHDADSCHSGTWTFSLVQESPAAKLEPAQTILEEKPIKLNKKTSKKRKSYKKQ
jgi:hypothetical protein